MFGQRPNLPAFSSGRMRDGGRMLFALVQPLAHETWFVHDDVSSDWGFVGQTETLALLAITVILTIVARLIAKHVRTGIDLPKIGAIWPWLPFIMRMHLGVSLVGLLSLGYYLSPTMHLHWNVVSFLLGGLMLLVAVMVFAGWHTTIAAWLLIAAGPIGALEYSVLDIAQRFDLFGVAAFLLFTGSGRWSADDEAGRAPALSERRLEQAAWALRMVVGATLILVAFNEKLAQPDLALKFLQQNPHFNVFAELGLGTSDLEFTRIAGAIEVLFGLLIIGGALPQLGVVAIAIPFNLTLFFFGTTELIGHLPVYATIVVLLVLGSTEGHRRLLMSLWPFGSDLPARESGAATGAVAR
jgi:hypothetical protein